MEILVSGRDGQFPALGGQCAVRVWIQRPVLLSGEGGGGPCLRGFFLSFGVPQTAYDVRRFLLLLLGFLACAERVIFWEML